MFLAMSRRSTGGGWTSVAGHVRFATTGHVRFATRGQLVLLAGLLVVAALAQPAVAVDAEQVSQLRAALEEKPDDAARRTRLGDALFRDGQALPSMVALNPGRTPDASWVPELRKAAKVYASVGRIEPAARTPRDAIRLAPGDRSLYRALKRLYADMGIPPPELPEPPADAPEVPAPVEETAPVAVAEVAVPEAGAARPEAAGWLAEPANRRRALLALAALTLLLVVNGLRSLLRGKGDLAVSIEVPPDRRGTFSVRLARKRERARQHRGETAPKARASSRFEHNLIARETHFRGVPARSYWVVVEGLLETSDGGHQEAVREEQEVAVARGLTARAEFDLQPSGCPVEVRLLRGGRPVPGRVALGRDPNSLRLARGGIATLTLAEGSYQLLAGTIDRATEHLLEIEGFTPRVVELDLDDPAILPSTPARRRGSPSRAAISRWRPPPWSARA
jgi:hypothetical protein